jgi:hypothetical protein
MDDFEVLSTIVGALKQLEPDAQRRVLQSVQTFLGLQPHHGTTSRGEDTIRPSGTFLDQDFSRDRTLSPKEFLRDKEPVTDVERVTCIAYYLTHYRDTTHFKTIDISTVNTEAAQPKLSNATVAVDNARGRGFLVPASKGSKQITAAGEKFVELLPDRAAAWEAVRTLRPRRSSKRKKTARKGSVSS